MLNARQSKILNLIGSLYQQASESLVGKINKVCLDQINFDKAFIGIGGYTAKAGFTLRDLFRAEISSYIIKKSSEVIIITDLTRFGKTELTSICELSEIKQIANDNELDERYRLEFMEAGVDQILA